MKAAAALSMFLVTATIGAGAWAADPNAELAKPHGGKVWVQADPFPTTEGSKLGSFLTGKKPGGELTAKAKDAPWVAYFLAVFKKPAIKGPMTVQFYEKGDPKNVVDQYSPPNATATLLFQGNYELSPDLGFNKGRTYVIRVGQILKKKFVAYASGQVELK